MFWLIKKHCLTFWQGVGEWNKADILFLVVLLCPILHG